MTTLKKAQREMRRWQIINALVFNFYLVLLISSPIATFIINTVENCDPTYRSYQIKNTMPYVLNTTNETFIY